MQQTAIREPSSPSQQAKARSQRRLQKTSERHACADERDDLRAFAGQKTLQHVGRRHTDDGGDPHDLSFSPKHIPRTSMMDNMVKSLDQFSNPSSPFQEPRLVQDYTNRPSDMEIGRRRGHTISSSLSSEGELREAAAWAQNSVQTSKLGRRNSAAKFPRQPLPSIFGEDEDSVRSRVFDSQRATRPAKLTSRRHARGKDGKTTSAGSSVDLSHLSGLKLGPAGNRRSRSFDFGSSRVKSSMISAPDPVDVAPTPVVFGGPEAQNSPTKATFSALNYASRNNVRSTQPIPTNKSKSGTPGPTVPKIAGYDTMPSLPSTRSSPALFNARLDGHSSQNVSIVPPELTVAPRPGFFRRVFGSSRTNQQLDPEPSGSVAGRTSTQGRVTPVRTEDVSVSTPPLKLARVSSDVMNNKQNQQTIVKKSSFFRRRKKSNSNIIPPPLPLTLSTPTPAPGEPSPISSLKALMSLYLGDGQYDLEPSRSASDDHNGFHTAQSTPQLTNVPQEYKTQPNAKVILTDGQRFNASSEGIIGSRLQVPHHESFLADASSTDDSVSRSSRRSPTTPISPSDQALRIPSVTSIENVESVNSSLSNVSSMKPMVTPRQESFNQNKDLPSSVTSARTAKSSPSIRPRLGINTSEDRSQQQLVKESPKVPPSETSEYRSAPSTPLILDDPVGTGSLASLPPKPDIVAPAEQTPEDPYKIKARQIYENTDSEIDPGTACGWLCDPSSDRERYRKEYMKLFEWSGMNFLACLRSLCDRIAVKGEGQQLDRMLDAFAERWCECNPRHGFKAIGKAIFRG